LYVMYYFRWTGTSSEIKDYVERVNKLYDKTKDVNFKGVFIPTSEWTASPLFEGTSYNKVLAVYKEYIMKYGPHPKISLGKVEILHTFEELRI
jgi:hypothetical protein